MEISLDLYLPRDAASVPLTRQILDAALGVLGVEETVRGDIQIMLTEACTNVIRHAGDSDDYAVQAAIVDERCLIKVIDKGHGFDGGGTSETSGTSEGSESSGMGETSGTSDLGPEPGPTSDLGPGAEHGRGVLIMRRLADDVRFTSFPDDGTLVTLEKHLFYGEDTAGSFLSGSHPLHEGAVRTRP